MAVSRSRGRDVEAAPPKSDAFTAILAISLVAMVVGCTLLFLDYNSYPTQPPPVGPSPAFTPAAAQPAPAPAPSGVPVNQPPS